MRKKLLDSMPEMTPEELKSSVKMCVDNYFEAERKTDGLIWLGAARAFAEKLTGGIKEGTEYVINVVQNYQRNSQ